MIDGQKRGFGFSFDQDEKNRLYEITNDGGDDYGPNGTSQIKGFITTGRYDFNKSGMTNKFIRKKITGGEMWMSNIPGEVTSQVEYRSDSNPLKYTTRVINQAYASCVRSARSTYLR